MAVDLFLGSDLGLWVLDQVDAHDVACVLTVDEEIAEKSTSLGLRVALGNANEAAPDVSDVGLSVHYPRILKPKLLDRYRTVYNLHPGYLPWGRGFYPIFWALWEQTPAGATLHEITPGIDEGPVVAQREVDYSILDTGGAVYDRVRAVEKEMFLEYWPRIAAAEELPSSPQPEGGTYHPKKEFFEIKQRARWESMNGCDLIRLVRALTFPGFTGLEIELKGQRFQVRLDPLPTPDCHE